MKHGTCKLRLKLASYCHNRPGNYNAPPDQLDKLRELIADV